MAILKKQEILDNGIKSFIVRNGKVVDTLGITFPSEFEEKFSDKNFLGDIVPKLCNYFADSLLMRMEYLFGIYEFLKKAKEKKEKEEMEWLTKEGFKKIDGGWIKENKKPKKKI